MWMSLGKVRLDHRVEEGLVDRRQGLGLDFLRGDDLLLVEDDKVEAEMEGVHDRRKCDDCKCFMDTFLANEEERKSVN